MNTNILNQKGSTKNLKDVTNSIAFQVQCLISLPQGSSMVGAIGYIHLSSNQEALRMWVFEYYDGYSGQDRNEMVTSMARDINQQIEKYFDICN